MGKSDFLSERILSIGDPIGENADIVKSLERKDIEITKLIMGDPSRYFKTQENIIAAYNNAVNEGKTFYLEGPGLKDLRNAVSDRYSDMYNTNFDRDKVVITQGVIEGLQFLNKSLIYSGDSAILLAPFFTQYVPRIIEEEGVPLIATYDESRGWDIDIESLESIIKKKTKKPKYILITNPNNPTGTVATEKTLKELVNFANNNGIFLVSDEIYDEIIFNKARFFSMSKLAKDIPHMILNGASKNFVATGFRLGFAIIPGNDKKSTELRNAFVKLSYSRLSANTPSQYAILEGLRNKKEHSEFISKIVPKIAKRSNLAAKLINETGYLTTVRPNSAFYLFAKIRFDLLDIKNDRDFVTNLLKEQHIQITRGSSFGVEGHVRLVTLPDEEILYEAINKIRNFCDNHKK